MMKNLEKEPVLYILMRTDMDSMNPGKAIAQGSHATSYFMSIMEGRLHNPEDNLSPVFELYKLWKSQTEFDFGTVIVLDAGSEARFNNILDKADERDLFCATITDPTYPVQDGLVTHLVPVTTCGFVFGDKNDNDLFQVVHDLELHY